jgi:uncharacterized protein (TIGR01777 family)
MRVVVSGGSGLVGSATTAALRLRGFSVNRLVRPGGAAAPGDVRWNPARGEIEAAALEGADAVVHLAGASVAEGRWSDSRKQLLRSSRVDSTRLLVESLGRLQRRPKVFISASAVGFYGNRGDEILTEESSPGNDFLAALAREWEAEALRAESFGIRAAEGGALARMLLPFKLGLGGKLGSGRQWMSWLSLPEAVQIIQFALENDSVRGPVNAVAPHPVTNAEFTRMLARVLRRPALAPVPAFVLKLLLGEMAEALLLASQRVVPGKLTALGYAFQHPELEPALRFLLRRRSE